MIRTIFDKWAGTRLGLLCNVSIFAISVCANLLIAPWTTLFYCMWVWGLVMIIIYGYGVSMGWPNEREDE
jgi:uncharacterized membrane protein YczE